MTNFDWKNHKFDSSDSAFFEKQLEYISSIVIDEAATQVPLDYAQYIPVSTEFSVGAANFTWTELSATGRAKFISDSAKDIPTVSIGGKQHSITQKMCALAYDFTKMEILRARYAGVPLESRKVAAVVRGIQELIDAAAWTGDADHGIQGFVRYPGTTEVTIADGASGNTQFSTKTAEEILSTMEAVLNGVRVPTNYMEEPDTIILPPKQYNQIAGMQKSTATDTTVLEWFKRNHPGINVVSSRRVVGADIAPLPGDSADVMIAYKKAPSHLQFHLPLSYEQEAPQQDGLSFFVPAYAIVGGTIIYRPLSVAWGSGI